MQNLLDENLTEFIRHYLTKSGVEVKQNEIYFEIKERISKGDTLSYLQDLCVFAEYYAKFLNPEREKKEHIRKYLHRLNRLEVFTVYPFLLNCYDDWMKNRITEEELVLILKTIENFLLRRFICNIQTRGLNRIFALLYSQVSKDSNLVSDSFVKRLKLALQSRDYPKDSEFKSRLMDVKLYGSNRSEKARLILESIEEYFQHKEPVSPDNLSIEHVMPQTLNCWWKEHLGEDWALSHELLIHSLGNLTLTAYNGELSNDDFLAKRTHFQNSHLELNKYFQNKNSWRREDIEERAAYLAEIALQIWSYFGDELAISSQSSSSTGSIPKILNIFGQEYSVKTWRDVLEITLNTIINVEPDRFKEILQNFPRFVGWDEKDFQSTRTLQNGAFVEVNLSAKNIYTFCLKVIETAEISVEEWYVETAEAQIVKSLTKLKHKWNEQLFFSELEKNYDASQTNIAKAVLEWGKANVSHIWWGEGNPNYGSFVPTLLHKGEKYQLFSVFISLTKCQIGIEIYFQWYLGKPPFDSEEKRLELLSRLNLIEGVSIPVDKITKRPVIPLYTLEKESDLRYFLDAFDWFIQAVKAL